MPSDSSSGVKFEIGHVLFIDIVGYSKLLINEQSEQIQKLKEIVRSTEQFRSVEAEGKLMRLPTGDGGALVFRTSPEAPVLCALEISKALKSNPKLQVRMGIHSGPVNEVTDLNEQANIAGAGINMAQRVMDCGDAGHILLSKRVSDDLEHYPQWRSYLHDLGECEVKHGVRVSLVNLYTEELGNPEVPEKFRQAKKKEQATPAVAGRGEELWVAVLPFKSSGDAEMESFANGLGEDITTGLSRFRYLSVVASASAARLKGEAGDERTLGAKLGARYVLEGSIRKGGSGIRVSAQLVDTQTGAQLWAETYNRDLQASSIFAAQDDVAARIVATVADSYGVLVHSMRSAMRQKDDADLTPVEWQFQYFAYREQITPLAHAALKSRLERAAAQDDRQSDLWACLAQIYVDEYAFGFPGDDETSLDRALAAARRGVELDRANQFAMVALAQTHFFRQDLAAFGPAAERAMALNPLNTDALGILGLQIVHTGEFERGTAIVRRAMELNANHAGWMHFAPLWDHFHKGEYEQSLECANRVDVPGLFWPFLVMASACGHLGRRAEAKAAVRDLLALDPEFAAHARSYVGTWHFASGLMDPILEGLRKAGLSIPENESSDSPRRNGTVTAKADRAKSGAVRAEEGFWAKTELKNAETSVSGRSFPGSRLVLVAAIVLVAAAIGWWLTHQRGATPASPPTARRITSLAVLPFRNYSGGSNQEYFADGMTDLLTTELSGISALTVKSHQSALKFKGSTKSTPEIGQELHADAIVEGSVLREGNQVTVNVQLIEALTDRHLWAKKFDGDVTNVFKMRNEVVEAIAREIKTTISPEQSLRLSSARAANPEALQEYLLGRQAWNRQSEKGFAEALKHFNRAKEIDPGFALAWAGVADVYWGAADADIAPTEARAKAKAAAQRALELDDSLAEAHTALAAVNYVVEFQWAESEREFQRAIQLKPNYAFAHWQYGWLLIFLGRAEEALQEMQRAVELDPLSPVMTTDLNVPYQMRAWKSSGVEAKREYDKAIAQCRKALELDPSFFLPHFVLGTIELRAAETYSKAIEEFRLTQTMETQPIATGYLGYAYAMNGQRDKAMETLEELNQIARRRFVTPYCQALVYLGLRENGKAIDWLEKAYEGRSVWLGWLKVEPMFDPLRSDPRFQTLYKKMNFPP